MRGYSTSTHKQRILYLKNGAMSRERQAPGGIGISDSSAAFFLCHGPPVSYKEQEASSNQESAANDADEDVQWSPCRPFERVFPVARYSNVHRKYPFHKFNTCGGKLTGCNSYRENIGYTEPSQKPQLGPRQLCLYHLERELERRGAATNTQDEID